MAQQPPHLSLSLRAEWSWAEERKKKAKLNAQKNAWSSFISNLGSHDQPRLWSIVKCMADTGVNHSPDGTSITVGGVSINDPLKKSDVFADHFSRVFPPNIPLNPQFQHAISSISDPPSILPRLIGTSPNPKEKL
jgi:hypothetical protein